MEQLSTGSENQSSIASVEVEIDTSSMRSLRCRSIAEQPDHTETTDDDESEG